MRIRKTKKIDRIGLIRAARKFGVAPLFVDSLQRDKVVELPDDKARALIDRGYAIRAGGHAPVDNVTVDDQDVETTETVSDHHLANEDDDEEQAEDDIDIDHDIKLGWKNFDHKKPKG